MEIPKGLTLETLEALIDEHVVTHYRTEGKDLICGSCETKIEVIRGTASVCFGRHQADRPCGGGGDTEEFSLPYCPTCDGVPKETATCVHTLPMLSDSGTRSRRSSVAVVR